MYDAVHIEHPPPFASTDPTDGPADTNGTFRPAVLAMRRGRFGNVLLTGSPHRLPHPVLNQRRGRQRRMWDVATGRYRSVFHTGLPADEAFPAAEQQLRGWLGQKDLDREAFDKGRAQVGPAGELLLVLARNAPDGTHEAVAA